jgi:hypothetical protein
MKLGIHLPQIGDGAGPRELADYLERFEEIGVGEVLITPGWRGSRPRQVPLSLRRRSETLCERSLALSRLMV